MGVGEDAQADARDGGYEAGGGGGGLVRALPGHREVRVAVGGVYFDDGVVDPLVFLAWIVFLGGWEVARRSGRGGGGGVWGFAVVVAVGGDFP